ncbi:Hairy/enhancer-of-split with YRPW motif protein 2 [Marasmius sp. AFHP31]|nr:Hairy/enhancer-of-split with YRPW motif protein 2 [Marasmius sp. AFHP31]
MSFAAPYPPYDPTDKSGRLILNRGTTRYETVVKRWPIILTSIVDQLHQENHALQAPGNVSDDRTHAKVVEGKTIIEQVSKLKYQMARDHALEPIPEDGEPLVDLYNSELGRLAEKSRNTWFTAPWLYAECYLYGSFACHRMPLTSHIFHKLPILALSIRPNTALAQLRPFSLSEDRCIASSIHDIETAKDTLKSEASGIEALFQEMIQMCLCPPFQREGAMLQIYLQDLSLLTHMTLSDIEKLQTVEKEAQSARKQFILKDDQEQAWNHVKGMKGGRVDFVLDNAGFEVFTDLVFADFLVTYTPHVSKVVFHGKLIPWFVSDVTPSDFKYTIEALLDPSHFTSTPPSEEDKSHLQAIAARIARYLEEGVFVFSVPTDTPLGGSGAGSKLGEFWTNPLPYWDMERECPDLWNDLRNSELVIFKGDLNYRKLTGDIQWPSTTPFKDAVGPLAGSFPLLSLRTNKADVAVGITQEALDEIEKKDDKWRVNGKYALISFLPRTK